MKVVSYNIQYGLGKDLRCDLLRIAEAVRGADIIGLQEVERFWPRPEADYRGEDQPQVLADLLPDYYWSYQPAFDVDASKAAGDGRIKNRRRQHGNLLMAKWPILSSRSIPLPKFHFEEHFNMRMGAMEGVLQTPFGAIRVYVVHLGYLTEDERLKQLDSLLAFIAAAPAERGAWSGPETPLASSWLNGEPAPPMPQPLLCLGDFNSQPDSAAYATLTAQDDARPQLIDSWVATGQASHEGNTCPYKEAPDSSKTRRIDYCFVTAALEGRLNKAWIDEDAQGSDHQPIWVELNT